VHPIQGLGIVMTFLGLWMYNNAKGDVERGEKKMRRVEAARDLVLPSTNAEEMIMSGMDSPTLMEAPVESTTTGLGIATAYGRLGGMSMLPQRLPIQHTHPLPLPMPQSHTHTYPNLHIKVTPPSAPTSISIPKRGVVLSLDSYPSPPSSLDDSPPSNTVPLPHAHSVSISEARSLQTQVSA
jgi:solute carrier family 35 protein E1